MKRILLVAVTLLLAASLAQAQNSTTDTVILSVVVSAEAAIVVTGAATTDLASITGIFGNYVGNTSLTYWIRTAPGVATGDITMQLTAFSPIGGPVVADDLTYMCSSAASGSPCSGPLAASSTGPTPVVTFAEDAHSTIAGDAAGVAWTLINDPAYPVTTYTSTVTFTISAT
jgi:hypothetical protein